LADLHACVEAGKADYLERFRDKIVIVGSVLDVEDRRVTSRRFIPARPTAADHPRCMGAYDEARFGEILDRHSMPGVFIHAAAINTLTQGLEIDTLPMTGRFLTVLVAAVAVSILFFWVSPIAGTFLLGGIVAAEVAAGVILLLSGTIIPLIALSGSAVGIYGGVYAFRFVVENKEKRWIKQAFRHYLAPALVEKLADNPKELRLGGHKQEITVLFSDIAGFTTLSETMADRPEVLVELLNGYLTIISDVIERHEGYVDKFVGDAVMALWGSPLDDPDGATNAVRSAIEARNELARFNREVALPRFGIALVTRIGINTGVAVVGNMGSATRLNYTAMGDSVNLAARLEGANKAYGTRILVGEGTVANMVPGIVVREIDLLAVKGKDRPVRVYEAVGFEENATDELRHDLDTFARGLALYRDRRFRDALRIFDGLAGDDVAQVYVNRCRKFTANPPDAEWDGSHKLDSK
jgi:adenylate cyclase